MAQAQKRKEHPEWHKPEGSAEHGICVRNSLTSKVDPFIIKDNHVSWYTCGPTVYDSAHLGHARAYVTFDIIRRIMTDYFGLDVFYVMNITDIDDKIILKARRNFLFKEYEQAATKQGIDALMKDVHEACSQVIKQHQDRIAVMQQRKASAPTTQAEEIETEIKGEESKLKAVQEVEKQATALAAAKHSDDAIPEVLALARDQLAQLQDAKKGHTITDMNIFTEHARRYEREFMEDMAALGVRDPDATTRVTEYIEPIIAFVQKIIDNGFGYPSGGSVYFSTTSFVQKGHNYGKLAPWQVGNLSLAEEGEGSLNTGAASEKKHPNDFALWKKSKPGEPSWPSPWGPGRPGWHIECSAMASDLLGATFDLHTGGEDLRFPHHDNELAQAEAFFNHQQWVNYFMHAGHLNIQGLKMAKSLKNFITIRQVLQHFSARQIRLLFLLQPWDRKMNYCEESLQDAAFKENQFRNFFGNVKSKVRNANPPMQVWDKRDRDLHAAYEKARQEAHKALCNNFDTPTAMRALLDIVNETNKYLTDNNNAKVFLLQKLARYVSKMLRAFGVIEADEYGMSEGAQQGGLSKEKVLAPVLDALTAFRDEVRQGAHQKKDPNFFMETCDDLRDNIMPGLGVMIEDVPHGPGVWKLDDPEVLKKNIAEKKHARKMMVMQKLQNRQKTRQQDLEHLLKGQLAPEAMFKQEKEAGKYSQFDAQGVPTHDAAGKELSKSARKGLEKQRAAQAKVHAKYQEALQKSPTFVTDMQHEIEELKREIEKLSKE